MALPLFKGSSGEFSPFLFCSAVEIYPDSDEETEAFRPFFGQPRPRQATRKVQLCMAFPSFLVCTALCQRCKDLKSRRTISASKHSCIGIFESSRCRTYLFVHSMLYYFLSSVSF
ncbi:uncharacterized protein LOC125471626 [Pyrus x bretschneideri]|uniref:uncharacterized protein LOC125471626 n=1 Tax=Pyrus x bretschneideri TaxID=225117 RepID=UPI00202F7186|nr:uncharacterized protein LOC125471626 [Pyrus x bretschneideri]